MKHSIVLVSALAALFAVSACTTQESLSGSSYSRESARHAQSVRIGTILSIEEVRIEGDGGTMASIGGAVLGAAIGSTMGGGSGHTVGAAAGGVGGAALGSAVGNKLSQRKGIEITVQYPDGQAEVIVQEPGKDQFALGQQVRVLTEENGTKRVRPLPATYLAQ